MAISSRREIWRRAWKDWTGGHWLVRAVVSSPVGLGLAVGVVWLLGRWRMTAHYPLWVPGLIGAILTPIVWGLLTFAISRFRAPALLLRERAEEISRLRDELYGGRPVVDERLEIVEERLMKPKEAILKEFQPGLWRELPPYVLRVRLRAKVALDNPRIKIKCAEPIFSTSVQYYDRERQARVYPVDISKDSGSTILYNESTLWFGLAKVPAGGSLGVLIYSLVPTRLSRVELIDE
jgi:hypothetical protein